MVPIYTKGIFSNYRVGQKKRDTFRNYFILPKIMVLLYYFFHRMTDRSKLELGNKRWSIWESTWCVQQRLKRKSFPVIQAKFAQKFCNDKAPGRSRIYAWMINLMSLALSRTQQ